MESLPMEDEEMEYDVVGDNSYREDENVSQTRIFSVAQTAHLNSLYKYYCKTPSTTFREGGCGYRPYSPASCCKLLL